jgi:hypothetical protein
MVMVIDGDLPAAPGRSSMIAGCDFSLFLPAIAML